MKTKFSHKKVFPLLKESINTLFTYPTILSPFLTTIFLQLLILEIIYFIPRYPLVNFFAPIVQRLWGEKFLHYPFNFAILPKLFQYTQLPTYIFLNSFFIAAGIAIIAQINNDQKPRFASACGSALARYVHIVIGAILSFVIFWGLSQGHGFIVARAMQIRSTKGIFFILKVVVIYGRPYAQLLISVVVTTLFAFVVPVIMIEKRKILTAIVLNFRKLWGSFWFIFAVVLIPILFYAPVIFLRDNIAFIVDKTSPELRVVIIVLSIVVTGLIDAVIYTAITTYYLLNKENKE